MANETKQVLTTAGFKKCSEELHELKVVRRKEVAEKIKVAREQGDLSENADYDAAKEEQTEIENRIVELEALLRDVDVVDDSDSDPDIINIGSKVRILDLEYDEELEYQIVGTSEANSLKGKISNESPVGKELIGHKIGDTVVVRLEDGASFQYKVMDVLKSE